MEISPNLQLDTAEHKDKFTQLKTYNNTLWNCTFLVETCRLMLCQQRPF